MEYKIIETPMCSYKDCSNKADYALTDAVLADKDKKMEDRKIKTVVLAHACDKHFNEVRKDYAES